jgi:thiol-disulfide isomerase/thioredoxin
MPTLEDVRKDAPGATAAIEELKPIYRGGFTRNKDYYKLNEEALEKLHKYLDEYTIVATFAEWCGDARKAIPVLSLIEEATGKTIACLGGMTKPPYGSGKLWQVPPSPEEVDTFQVTSSPTILVFGPDGKEIGRIKTRAKMTPTIEEEIVKIIEDSRK